MSELKVDKVSPRTGNYVSLNTVGMKNIIINGDMSLAQRGTSVSVSDGSNEGYQTCDRYEFICKMLEVFLHGRKIQMYQLVKVLLNL
jgi:hypothetical protein